MRASWVLKRGYSITLKLPEDSVIDSVAKAKKGDDIKIILQDGALGGKVNEVRKTDVLGYGEERVKKKERVEKEEKDEEDEKHK